MSLDFMAGYVFGVFMTGLLSVKLVRKALAFPFLSLAALLSIVAMLIEFDSKDETISAFIKRKLGWAT